MSLSADLAQLAPSFGGQLLQPGDAAYEAARRVHNGLVDKRPALIARCAGTADVADAVRLARALQLPVAVRGGGHSVAGRATIDDGVMIDLSTMKGIHVDARARTARAQGGVLWKELNRETQAHGLATTGGVISTTGISGLTLGGGFGWLLPKHGLALDNLRSAEIVLADGRVVRAAADEEPDLFWAIRGGGGNFGIAASLEYDVHPVGPTITGGLVAHTLQRTLDVMRLYRDACATAPDELELVAGFLTAPDGSGTKLNGIVACHCGTLADGEAALSRIKTFGPPALDLIGPTPYTAQNTMLDNAFPKGTLNYWKSQFITDLSDDCIRTLADAFARGASPLSQIIVEHFHGKASRVPVADTACAMRVSGFNVAIIAQWTELAETDRHVGWARETYAALSPYFAGTRYVNYLDADEPADLAATVYGPNYPRLRDLKTTYDPDNVFRVNVNIRPR